MLQTTIGRLRVIGFIEGVSFLMILFVTMPLKYIYHQPQWNQKVGMLHGVLFIAYLLLVFISKIEYNWSWKKTLLAFVASIVPFGTFWADKKLFNEKPEI
jgi:integral membrane protein